MYTAFKCRRAEVFDNHLLRLTIDQVKEMTGADYVIGGWVFNNHRSSRDYLKPCNWVKINGQVISQDDLHEWRICCGYHQPPVMSVATTAPYILSGVPILKDGARLRRDLTPDVARPAERQAVYWLADGRVGLWCSKVILTREQLQDKLLALGAVSAIMLDGGGSVQGRGPGLHVASGRLLSNFLLFWEDNDKEDKPLDKKFTVCLDAGHSASNRYNKAPDGSYYEHEFALDLSQRIKALLDPAGVQVIETRPDGGDVSLGERCRIANTAKADLFVSLHSNATAQTKPNGWADPRGLEVYVYSKEGRAARAAKAIVQHMDDFGVVLRRYPVAENPSLYVLKHTSCPAVLIEHGFHTNQADVSLLRQNSYRQMLAIADAQGILDYLGVDYKVPGISAPEKPEPKPEPPKEPTEMERAVKWAQESGILLGNAQGDLMLDQPVTRGQMCVMLYRAMGQK